MMKRSNVLEDTKLWHVYLSKLPMNDERITWIKKVYKTAVINLKEVAQEFRNYTLHDEIHVLNVLDAMGGLLGVWTEKLTVGEIELLILAASLHDLGMVYTKEDKAFYFEDEASYKKFLTEYCPELIGNMPNDWPEDVQQWYLRALHPFRVSDVLQNKIWKELFENCPRQTIPKRCILAVCQAHGEEPRELQNNRDLEYLEASDADPLFCALLLRLADLLDFDDTRAPKVLYGNTAYSEKSREEWEKHQASSGFRYPESPSIKELPYKAQCKNPAVEHAVRNFLDWVDDELGNCARLQRYCKAGWRQEFPFPRAVSRSEIESDGYMSGDFCLTMAQDQILKLLMGENLYDNRDVFVRELLQNAIDATLLRAKMDSSFVQENARIDFWEWSDSEGNLWFRIDDQGTGMTLGMMRRYFLKVGNSYYTSQELERDLSTHGHTREFRGISRFGIGFLSCFLCGESAEVSTLYFEPQKNRQEESALRTSQAVKYGLRLQVTGLTGYYTLKNQAEKHPVDAPLPLPDFYDDSSRLERNGYRAKPGTSIVLRLNPGKLGALNLRETIEKYLYAARIPVYYNNKRVGRTYAEVTQAIHKMAGEQTYELSPDLKSEFDEKFPNLQGNYPILKRTVISLDTENNLCIPNLSGAIVKYNVSFEKELKWREKGQNYKVSAYACCWENITEIYINSGNANGGVFRENRFNQRVLFEWSNLYSEYRSEDVKALEKKFDTFKECPQTEEQLGDAWNPFTEHEILADMWTAYINSYQEYSMKFNINECGCKSMRDILGSNQSPQRVYAYQGIAASVIEGRADTPMQYDSEKLILLEEDLRPAVDVSRLKILDMPLEPLLLIWTILNKYELLEKEYDIYNFKNWNNISLWEWRNVRTNLSGQWIMQNLEKLIKEIIYNLQNRWNDQYVYLTNINSIRVMNVSEIGYKYIFAYFQDTYYMTINYEKAQAITFLDKEKTMHEEVYDIFPPMMFCKAATDNSRKYICHAYPYYRRGITADHPFIKWLLKNALQLKQHFERQFQQIVECLYQKEAEDIIQEYTIIREQFNSLSNFYNLDIKPMPEISSKDFCFE